MFATLYMAYIKDFGFQIYRLTMAQDNCEFLIYDEDKKKFYQYSLTRGKSMLQLMFEKIVGLSLLDYIMGQQLIPDDVKNPGKCANIIYNNWIREEIMILDNINYNPTLPRIYDEDLNTYFNIYNKSQILNADYTNVEPKFPNIKKILNNLVDGDKKAYMYICNWLAWQLQNPQQRLATSIILKGEHGTGKTLLCNYVLRPIFENNYIEVGQSDLSKDYNDYIMGKQLVVANEVIHSDNKLSVPEKLKNYVSDDYVSIQRKYKDSLNVKNYAHWIFISNNQIPIKLTRNDRRYSVFSSKILKNGFQIFLSLKKNQNSEVKGFVKYLMDLRLDFEKVNIPYKNQSRKDLIEASLNSVELFMETIMEAGGLEKLNSEYSAGDNIWHNYLFFLTKPLGEYIKLDGLYNLYLKFCIQAGYRVKYGRNGFTSILKHLNFKISVIKDDDLKSHRCMLLGGGIVK